MAFILWQRKRIGIKIDCLFHMILISKYLVPYGYTGMTLYPFIILKYSYLKADKLLINHEKIHLRQQLELLVFPFYLVYGLEFLIRLIALKNWRMAYQRISFEREAYIHQSNMQYLNKRPLWAFIKFL